MNKIIYNENNLKDNEINNEIKRAKIVLINSNNEILLANAKNNYFLIGGHVDNNETDIETLRREILEEAGIELEIKKIEPFLSIIYKLKDRPEINLNTKYIANYYYLRCDKKINYNRTNLTEEEKQENFKLEYVNINVVLDLLNDNLKKVY